MCYAYYYDFNRGYEPVFEPVFTKKSVLYPDKEVRIERYKEAHKGESTEEYEAWLFVFYVECFGQNLKELKEYIEDDCKGFIDFIAVYNESTGSEKLSVQFSIKLEKLKYL